MTIWLVVLSFFYILLLNYQTWAVFFRLALSSWTCTAILFLFMMLNHWRRSQMPTLTSIFGTKQTRGACFLHG